MSNSFSNRPGRQTMFNIQPTDFVPFETSSKMTVQMMPLIASRKAAPISAYQRLPR